MLRTKMCRTLLVGGLIFPLSVGFRQNSSLIRSFGLPRKAYGRHYSTSSDMLGKKVWAVVGSHGRNPIADELVRRLQSLGKTVHAVNPSPAALDTPSNLEELAPQPEVVDLVINPRRGPDVVEEMGRLGISLLWVQPGAEFDGLQDKCQELGIAVHYGCVLAET
eukprot:scaffold5443_cov291-Pinguiococcus_pyrenoidosus.AAC.20